MLVWFCSRRNDFEADFRWDSKLHDLSLHNQNRTMIKKYRFIRNMTDENFLMRLKVFIWRKCMFLFSHISPNCGQSPLLADTPPAWLWSMSHKMYFVHQNSHVCFYHLTFVGKMFSSQFIFPNLFPLCYSEVVTRAAVSV